MSQSKAMSSEEARLSWREILDAAAAGDDVTIHRHRKPTAVLISYEDYIALADELDDLRAARRATEILARAQDDPDAWQAWDEIRGEMLA
ncbi:MAG: type II toxin-antitoxin system prevent-host-death family antitoxin [Caldilineaceae bacterium]|nr:type II toxin-antitoxin system prevent-host-death family antitoxin [Caldilineaceae bacterium]